MKEEVIEAKRQRIIQAVADPHRITRELNNRSLYRFLQWAWPEISSQPFVDNWHIKYLCDELQKVGERVGARRTKKYDLLINVPPGSTKTIICSIVFPAWCWTRWYWMRFITASYSSTLSLESAEYSRDLIKSSRFQQIYPELSIKADKDTKSNFKIVKRIPATNGRNSRILLGGNRYSTSVGGTLTGFHADIIIWDDPLNPQQAASDKEIESANRWLDQTLPTRKTNKAITPTIGIMQRLHEDDPSGHLLTKTKGNLKHICLPGEIRDYREMVRPQSLIEFYKDNLMDVNRLPWKVLQELEIDLGGYGYAGQIGQSPTPAGGGMFRVENLQMLTEIIERSQIVKTVRYWDKAASVDSGAYTVGVKMSRLKNGTFLVEDVKRGQWSSERREKVIRQTAIADGPHVDIVIEQEPGSGGKESAQGSVRNLAGFKVKLDRPTGDKAFRADPYSVQVNYGNVFLRVADWNKAYKDELELFPNSRYKDQVDASSGAFSHLVAKKKVQRIT
jgi:predicted phage terminase large subunit-like protein